MTAEETKEFLNTFVERVEIGKEGMWVTLTANRLSMKLPSLLKKKAGNLSMEVMIKGNWHVPGDRQQSFLEEGEKIQTDEALRKAFLKTQQWIEMIEKGGFENLADLARVVKCHPDTVYKRVRAFRNLSPKVKAALEHGTLSGTFRLSDFIRKRIPEAWQEQEKILGV